jgi:probable HAF family extracellular repeat protein
MLRPLRNFWMPWVTTIVLAFFSNAVAQVSYKVTDLGVLHSSNNLGCAMDINNEGWAYVMSADMPPGEQDELGGTLLDGRAMLEIGGFKIDLGSLGGKNTWMNWGRINDFGQIVGYSETKVPDPNGEDVCGFGTHMTCRPFIWQLFHMSALQTLGGNNGQASGINLAGQIAGFAENGNVDPTCPSGTTNNHIVLGTLWANGNPKTIPQVLPPVGSDPDSIAIAINNHGQAAGLTGNCTSDNDAVLWQNGVPTALPDLGVKGSNLAWDLNDQGQVVGEVFSSDGSTVFAAFWPNPNQIISLGTLPGDVGSLASGINNQGQIVGSTWDSTFSWSHAFIYQNGVMTDLNTLFPKNSNLLATMGNRINDHGQISGMAIVQSGPDKGNIHAFLATPVRQSIGESMADVARTLPKMTIPANVGNQVLRRFGPLPSGR